MGFLPRRGVPAGLVQPGTVAGQILVWNGTAWVPNTAPTATGQVLTWNGAAWVPTSPWSPQTLVGAGLLMWLANDAPSTDFVQAAGVVQTWNDRSGLTHSPTQAAPGARPAYNLVGGPLGRPYVTGVIANSARLVASWAQSQPVYIAGVRKVGATAVNVTDFDGGGGVINTMRFYYDGAQWALHAGAALAGFPDSAGWHIVEAIFNGATSVLTKDGSLIYSGNAGAGVPGGICLFSAGDDRFYSPSSYAELLMIDAAVATAAVRSNALNYLRSQHGL